MKGLHEQREEKKAPKSVSFLVFFFFVVSCKDDIRSYTHHSLVWFCFLLTKLYKAISRLLFSHPLPLSRTLLCVFVSFVCACWISTVILQRTLIFHVYTFALVWLFFIHSCFSYHSLARLHKSYTKINTKVSCPSLLTWLQCANTWIYISLIKVMFVQHKSKQTTLAEFGERTSALCTYLMAMFIYDE